MIDNLISFDPIYIKKLLAGITNINDKTLIAVYTLTPPWRIMDCQLMKIKHQTNIDQLREGFDYLVIENEIRSLFVFVKHRTQTSKPEPKITIPNLATILNTYIDNNDMVKNDFYLV